MNGNRRDIRRNLGPAHRLVRGQVPRRWGVSDRTWFLPDNRICAALAALGWRDDQGNPEQRWCFWLVPRDPDAVLRREGQQRVLDVLRPAGARSARVNGKTVFIWTTNALKGGAVTEAMTDEISEIVGTPIRRQGPSPDSN